MAYYVIESYCRGKPAYFCGVDGVNGKLELKFTSDIELAIRFHNNESAGRFIKQSAFKFWKIKEHEQ